MLAKFTELPLSDEELQKILVKEPLQDSNYLSYKSIMNIKKMNDFSYYKIQSFSSIIDSVAVYQLSPFKIYGRSPADYTNTKYSAENEPWMQQIIENDGAQTIIGVHQNFQLSPSNKYVISVGRSN